MHFIYLLKLISNILLLSLPTISYAGSEINIWNKLKPNTVTIIGETHKHPESITLFQSLIYGHLKHNNCLTVGLEIASNQQLIIDKIKQGRATVSDIEIPSMIDHPALREMINTLVRLQRKNSCLKIIAIDAGDDIDLRRDEWMAIKLTEQVDNNPILVLLGSLHSLKRVDWDLSITKGLPYVAEIISSQGYNIRTYSQIWSDKTCSTQYRFIKTAIDVVDGIILWECEK